MEDKIRKKYFRLCGKYKKKYGPVPYDYKIKTKTTTWRTNSKNMKSVSYFSTGTILIEIKLEVHHIYYGRLVDELDDSFLRHQKKYLCYVTKEEHDKLHREYDKYIHKEK